MDSHWDTNKAVARGNNAATLTALPMLSMALVLLPPALYKYVVHWLATLISIASDLDIDLYVESCGGSAAVDSVGAAASSSAHFRRALDCCCHLLKRRRCGLRLLSCTRPTSARFDDNMARPWRHQLPGLVTEGAPPTLLNSHKRRNQCLLARPWTK